MDDGGGGGRRRDDRPDAVGQHSSGAGLRATDARHDFGQSGGNLVVRPKRGFAERAQLFPARHGAVGLGDRAPVDARLVGVRRARLLAVRSADVRLLAGVRLRGRQRVRVQHALGHSGTVYEDKKPIEVPASANET